MTNCDCYTLAHGGLGVQTRDAVGRMFLAASNLAAEGASERESVWGEGEGRGVPRGGRMRRSRPS